MGGGSTRTLVHTFEDSRGLTLVTIIEYGTGAKGSSQTIGDGVSRRTFALSRSEFEDLWGRLDEAKLSPYVMKNKSDEFNAKDNYVIMKGLMPGGTKTYSIPKSKAPPDVKSWIAAFRSSTRS